ncbi:MAG: poly-gamma-glutamate biosynthesis protein PgsC [Acidobacteriota bacterium]
MQFDTLIIGFVLALLYTELTGLYPGGIIVPAFLALYLDHPVRAVATVATACLSLLLYRFIARYFILFGKRRFVVMLLLGGAMAQLWILLAPSLFSAPPELRVIGLVIPGLLASNLERQKFLPTLASLATVSVATYFISGLLRMIG